MRIMRQLNIHTDPLVLPCIADYVDDTGWMTITVSDEEKVIVFLTADQMRMLAERLITAADQAVPSHHLDEVSS